jgi:hypothetical protein
MLLKNKNFIKLISICITPLCLGYLFYYQYTEKIKVYDVFKSHIVQKHPECSVAEVSSGLIVKSDSNSNNILRTLVNLNVKINDVLVINNKITVYIRPEGKKPKILDIIKHINSSPIEQNKIKRCIVNYE